MKYQALIQGQIKTWSSDFGKHTCNERDNNTSEVPRSRILINQNVLKNCYRWGFQDCIIDSNTLVVQLIVLSFNQIGHGSTQHIYTYCLIKLPIDLVSLNRSSKSRIWSAARSETKCNLIFWDNYTLYHISYMIHNYNSLYDSHEDISKISSISKYNNISENIWSIFLSYQFKCWKKLRTFHSLQWRSMSYVQ